MMNNVSSSQLISRNGRSIEWSSVGDELLGTVPDKDLATRLMIARSSVTGRRLQLAIPAFVAQSKKHHWTDSDISKLGKMSDEELSVLLGTSLKVVASKRGKLKIREYNPDNTKGWSAERIAILGSMPDKEAGLQLGVHVTCVQRKRAELGVNSFLKQRIVWSESQLSQLGVISDQKLAAQMCVSTAAVYFKRRSLKIPSYRSKILKKK